MKRKMLLFTLALPVILCQNVQAQTASRLVGKANSVNNGASFTPVDSTNYTYSGNRGGDLKHTLKYDNSNAWNYLGDTAYSNAWAYSQTYDANNNVTSYISQYWSGTGWVLSTKNLYFYDTTMKLSAVIQQNWSGSSWTPVSQNLYTYLGSKLVQDQFQVWNSLTTSFENSSQKNYYYDLVSGNVLNETDINWVSSVPVNQASYTYTYTGSGQLSTKTYSTWNGASWDNQTKVTNTYDTTGNMTNVLAQYYNPSSTSWVNQNMHIYSSFSAAHNPMSDILQTYDTTTAVWNNVMQFTYSYNAYGQLTNSEGQSWNIVGAFEYALNDPKANYYYETYSTNVAVKNVGNASNEVNIYPVPAQNMLFIDLNSNEAQTATIAIYDMTGRVVSQWEAPMGNQYHSTIPVGTLSAGNYIVKVTGAQGQVVKQIVIAH